MNTRVICKCPTFANNLLIILGMISMLLLFLQYISNTSLTVLYNQLLPSTPKKPQVPNKKYSPDNKYYVKS